MSYSVTPSLHPRLLKHIGRFVGTWDDVVRELFQNVVRAGAKHLEVTTDGAVSIVTFTDDGPGLADPTVLLSAGETGWSEDDLVEPAGVGLMASVANATLFSRVEIRSRDWRINIHPATVTQLPTLVVDGQEPQRGFSISLYLHLARPTLKDELTRLRDFYPFRLTFNGEEIPVKVRDFLLDLETPVGRLCWQPNCRNDDPYSRPRAVWEGRVIRSDQLRQAMNSAARAFERQHAEYGLLLSRLLWSGHLLVWFPNRECGVTPILPTRHELSESAQLSAAAGTLVQTLLDWHLAFGRQATRLWPDQFPTLPSDLPAWCQGDLGHAMSIAMGWTFARIPDSTTLFAADDGDGYRLDWSDSIEHYARNGQAVTAQDLPTLVTARHLGLHHEATAEADSRTPAALIEFAGLRHSPQSRVSLASAIVWKGHSLPFALIEEAHDWPSCDLVIAAAHIPEALDILKRYQDVLSGWCVLRQEERDGLWGERWVEFDSDGYSLDWHTIAADLATDVIAGFADPAYQRHHETQRQLEDTLTHLAQALAVWPEGIPSETGVASVDARLKAAVKALRQARKSTANALARSVKGVDKHLARSRAAP